LEKVVFIPAKIHPLKNNHEITTGRDRLQMMKIALIHNPYFEINEIELVEEKTSYTVDTITKFLEIYPKNSTELYFLMGMDNVNQLHLWKEPERLLQICTIVAFGRPGMEFHPSVKNYRSHIKICNVPQLELSSTDIRKRVKNKRTIRYLVPSGVEDYINKNNLYR
jgi:nicotinate-nucleotide adenylyltransferase